MGHPGKTPLSILFFFFASIHVTARIFLVGSNPATTIFAFPQDIFLMPANFAYYYTSYQSLPWWGDIDEPDLRPNDRYFVTREKFVQPNGSSFEHKGRAYQIQNLVGFSRELSNGMRNRWDLSYIALPMRSSASGVLSDNSQFDTTSRFIDFNFEEGNSIHEIYLSSILGATYKDYPVGFKIGAGVRFGTSPGSELDIRKDNAQYSSNRLVWGWSANQGSDIFGSDAAEGDGRLQNEYSMGPVYRIDLQAGSTVPRHKMGARFRYEFATLDQFAWESDNNAGLADTIVGENFIGRYVKSPWAKKIRSITLRPYANFTWLEREKWRFCTLALTRYTQADTTGVLRADLSHTNGLLERSRTFVAQVNPNISIYPWKSKRAYIDAAILCNYSHMRYNFTDMNGAGEEYYVSTGWYSNEEYSWENYSYARQHFWEAALDIYTAVPLYGDPDQHLVAGLSLLLWTRYKWTNKYFGNGGTDFQVTNVRRNYDRESWLNTVVNVMYGRGNFNYRLDIGQPLIYSFVPRTRVTDADGGQILYESKKENSWGSLGGLKIGLFVATSLDNLKNMTLRRDGKL